MSYQFNRLYSRAACCIKLEFIQDIFKLGQYLNLAYFISKLLYVTGCCFAKPPILSYETEVYTGCAKQSMSNHLAVCKGQ